MNHDALSSSAANQDDSPDAGGGAQAAGRHDGPSGSRSKPSDAKDKAGLSKKLRFMTDLMTCLDNLVYLELCTLYYMECSFFRFFIRSTAQYLFLSPKAEDFLLLMPAHRPHVFAIFTPNIICILLHILSSLPRASEATRGYLHGGVMIDFIGQKPPTSRFKLLLLDCAILLIQCFMLAVHSEREKLRQIVLPMRRSPGSAAPTDEASSAAPPPTLRDHDLEERGIRADAPVSANETDEIEMQPLRNPRGGDDTAEDDRETSGLLDPTTSHPVAQPELIDVLRSGNAVLADFHVVRAIRNAGNDYKSAAAHSLQTLGYATTLARLAADRRAALENRNRPPQ